MAADNGNGAAGRTHQLPESGASAIDAYGSAVAISSDGGLAVVGAPAFGNNLGKAYVFQLAGGMPTGPGMELDDPTAGAGNEHCGASAGVAARGNAIPIGAPVGGNGVPSGKAYLFTGQGPSWNASHEFDNPAADLPGNFGASVALSGNGDIALVGAVNAPEGGAVFLFNQASGNWTQVRRIADPGHADVAAFGGAVALSEDGAAILAGAANTGVAGQGGAGIAYALPPVIVLAVNIKSDPPAAAGRSFRYFVSVTNMDASATATHVVMRDSLQAGVAYDFPADPACVHSHRWRNNLQLAGPGARRYPTDRGGGNPEPADEELHYQSGGGSGSDRTRRSARSGEPDDDRCCRQVRSRVRNRVMGIQVPNGISFSFFAIRGLAKPFLERAAGHQSVTGGTIG